MTITAVVLSHGNDEAVDTMVKSLREQTKPPDEIILIVCCIEGGAQGVDIMLFDKHREDWGHTKCAVGLQLATMDYVGFFSSDDGYEPTYLEKLSKQNADIVACGFRSHLVGEVNTPTPHVGAITRGCFLVEREFAQKIGYNSRGYSADGQFIIDLVNAGASFAAVPEVLHYHN